MTAPPARRSHRSRGAAADVGTAHAGAEGAASRDALTGLPDRCALLAAMEDRLAGARPFALAVLGLDRFRAVNDASGHSAGDRLLRRVGERLHAGGAGRWAVFRVAGDEFALLSADGSATERDAGRLVAETCRSIRADTSLPGPSASTGVVAYPSDGGTVDTLLRRAGLALAAAKRDRRGGTVRYDASMEADAADRWRLEQALRAALDAERFTLAYQPKARVRTGTLAGAEALLRWSDPVLGEVPPDVFLPVAVECGLMRRLDRWVIDRAVRDSTRLRAAGLPGRVAINLSAESLGSPQVVDWVDRSLREHAVEAGALEIEITEHSLLGDLEAACETLEALHRLGVRIALDDFGTGYASLEYLTRFPIDVVKVDRQFVHRMDADERSLKLVRAVIGLAHSLGMHVVAEGVETPGQLQALATLECDFVQGWLYARPMPLDALLDFVASARAGTARGAWNVRAPAPAMRPECGSCAVADMAPPAAGSAPPASTDLLPRGGPGAAACGDCAARPVGGVDALLSALAVALARCDGLAAVPQVAPLRGALDEVEREARALRRELERLSESAGLLGAALERMDQGLMMVDSQRVVQVCNRRARELLELPADLMRSRPRFEQVLAWQWARDEFAGTPEHLKAFVRAGGILDVPQRYERRRPDGRVLEIHSLPTEGGGVLRTYTDITERTFHLERIEWLARHDGLTGLLNRAAFLAAVRSAFDAVAADAPTTGGVAPTLAVHYLDLDGFKPINDRSGHAAGDLVLRRIGERLRDLAGAECVVGRLGGDEFAILQPGDVDEARALAFARSALAAIAAPIATGAGEARVGASIGVALPGCGTDGVEALLHAADLALLDAKAAGGGVRLAARDVGAGRDPAGTTPV